MHVVTPRTNAFAFISNNAPDSTVSPFVSSLTGRTDLFVLAAAIYAMGTAIIGASPAAYAADVMPADAAGLGLGIYRCAGDLGAQPRKPLMASTDSLPAVLTLNDVGNSA
jgi:hypothetical protein